MMLNIQKAVRRQRKFKGAFAGISGSGKTWTALAIMRGLVGEQGRILLLDTENYSSTLYSDDFDFDVADISGQTDVQTYSGAIKEAEAQGFDGLIIDSASHAWEWLLEEKENIVKRSRGSKNSFNAWSDITPIYNSLLKAITGSNIHVIATMRAKSEYIMEEYEDSKGKTKTKPVKIGLAPIFRAGGEYEFDLVANITLDHDFIVEKTRIRFLDEAVINKPTKEVGQKIREWLDSGSSKPVNEIPEGYVVVYDILAATDEESARSLYRAYKEHLFYNNKDKRFYSKEPIEQLSRFQIEPVIEDIPEDKPYSDPALDFIGPND